MRQPFRPSRLLHCRFDRAQRSQAYLACRRNVKTTLTISFFCGPFGAMRSPALKRALDAIGGVSKAAQAIGVTKQAVSSWRFPPAIHVVALSKLSGVPCQELRPDVFHEPAAEAAEETAA